MAKTSIKPRTTKEELEFNEAVMATAKTIVNHLNQHPETCKKHFITHIRYNFQGDIVVETKISHYFVQVDMYEQVITVTKDNQDNLIHKESFDLNPKDVSFMYTRAFQALKKRLGTRKNISTN